MRTPNIKSVGYTPDDPPADPAQHQRFLRDELRKISAAISLLADGHIDVTTVTPSKPRDGDIRYAMTWKSVRGLYHYLSSAWEKLLSSAGLYITEGSNKMMGAATLVAGTVTVNNTAVTANSRIFLCCQTPGGTPGFLRVSARVAGTSFTILSSSGTDTSTVAWLIVEPA